MVFNINDKSIIYVLCPAVKKTGGTELAHQLVYELNNLGLESYITYYNTENNMNPINEAFHEYVINYKRLEDIVDCESNVLIVPEICFDMLNEFCHIQKSIWWMSVDNYIKNDGFWNSCKYNGIYKSLRGLLSGRLTFLKKGFDKDVIHLYQSEYANDFLSKQNISKRYRLSDYINDTYLVQNEDVVSKEDIVLYNPKKGMKYTQKIIDASGDLVWLPIINMTTSQVRDILNRAKVYIDFGNHPGKDRFPREAAACGCCIITGKKGSAAYFEDIPIYSEFKFDEKAKVVDIVKKIRECIVDYENETVKFDNYRDFIFREHSIFKEDILKLFKQ